MKRQIFIYLGESTAVNNPPLQHSEGSASPQVSWVVREPGQLPGPVFYGDLETAANHATGCRVIVLVSGLSTLLTELQLPAMNKQRMAKAAPYALEEQVADDLENLHFALGKRIGEKTACAVVARGAMQQWQQLLKDAGIQADVLSSELLAVPLEENGWSILINRADDLAQKVLWRSAEQSALAVDLVNIPTLLRNYLDILDADKFPARITLTVCNDNLRRQTLISLDEPQSPENDDDLSTINSSPHTAAAPDVWMQRAVNDVIDEVQSLCDERGIELQINSSDNAYLSILSQGFSEAVSINLLQGEFSRIEQLEKLIRPWRAAIALVGVWLLVQLGVLAADYQRLVHKDAELREQIIAAYREAFPDARNIPDPKVQMERALAKLRGGGERSVDMFALLSKAGDVLKENDNMTLRSIRYKDDKMDIDLEISDLASLDELKLRLVKEAELEVEIVSASARSGKVESRLQVQLGQKANKTG